MMQTDQIDVARLRQQFSEWRAAAAASRGLMAELMAAQAHLAACSGRLGQARMALETRGRSSRDSDETWTQERVEIAEAQERNRRRMLAWGRENPQAFQEQAHLLQRPAISDFTQAVVDAESNYERAAAEVSRITEAQAMAGQRAGNFRVAVQRAYEWLTVNGHATIASEFRP
jgi:hypothetical protein